MTTHWSCRETNVVWRMIFFMSYFDGYLRQSFPNILGFCRLPAALLQKTSNFAVVEEIRSRNLKPSKLGGVVVTSLPTKIQSSIKYQYFLIKTKCKTHFVFYVVQMIWCSSIFWRNLSSPIFYSRQEIAISGSLDKWKIRKSAKEFGSTAACPDFIFWEERKYPWKLNQKEMRLVKGLTFSMYWRGSKGFWLNCFGIGYCRQGRDIFILRSNNHLLCRDLVTLFQWKGNGFCPFECRLWSLLPELMKGANWVFCSSRVKSKRFCAQPWRFEGQNKRITLWQQFRLLPEHLYYYQRSQGCQI